MGYVSDPLRSHIWLRNISYTLNFEFYTFNFWSLYLPSHFLIPPPLTPNNYQFTLFPCAQFVFVPVCHLSWDCGMPWLAILRKYPARQSDMRGRYLHPLFPQIWSGTSLSPRCSHFFPEFVIPRLTRDHVFMCQNSQQIAEIIMEFEMMDLANVL